MAVSRVRGDLARDFRSPSTVSGAGPQLRDKKSVSMSVAVTIGASMCVMFIHRPPILAEAEAAVLAEEVF